MTGEPETGRAQAEAAGSGSGRRSPGHRRSVRRAHWLALSCPVFAAAVTVGMLTAVWAVPRITGRPRSDFRGFTAICETAVPLINCVIGTIAAVATACRLQPVPDDRLGAGVTWVFAAPVVYFVAFLALTIAMIRLGSP